jgi:hypothetical protein
MKDKFRHIFLALALSALNPQLSTCFAQGSLTPPPGVPAPTMKSLDQVEARTIVNTANTPGDASDLFIISQPGSYYMITNLTGISGKNGIKITANNVTLDLNGFAMQGVSGSLNGISIPNANTNITMRNGSVSGWGVDGVSDTSSSAGNLVCERLNVSSSGTDGILFAGSGVIRDCNTQWNNHDGINCPGSPGKLITGCTASDNALHGIYALHGCNVKDCTLAENSQDGILAQIDSSVIGCTTINNGSVGIFAGEECTVKDCTTIANGSGISAGNNCAVKDCVASANTLDGIDVTGNNCQITGNTCSGNSTYGILINGVQNRIDNNSVGNNTSYGIYPNSVNVTNNITRNSSPGVGYGNFPGNNDYAPIGTPNTSTNPWQNFQ